MRGIVRNSVLRYAILVHEKPLAALLSNIVARRRDFYLDAPKLFKLYQAFDTDCDGVVSLKELLSDSSLLVDSEDHETVMKLANPIKAHGHAREGGVAVTRERVNELFR